MTSGEFIVTKNSWLHTKKWIQSYIQRNVNLKEHYVNVKSVNET